MTVVGGELELRGVIPVSWRLPPREIAHQIEVFVNWLDREVDEDRRPKKTDHLIGWRNREVYQYVQSYDWTARMFQ